MTSPGLELSGVQVGRGGRAVLGGVDLTVPAGSALAVLGPSGSGKSTLLAAIAGLHALDAGRIVLGGEVLGAPGLHLPPERRGVGMVFQAGALWPHVTAREHLELPLARWPRAERDARVAELLARLGLESLAHRLPHQLSGGEARRVGLGRALAARPRLLLLDEPLSGVDALARPELLELMRASVGDEVAALHVTHDPREARALAARVAVVADGRLVQTGTFDELARDPASPLVRRLVELSGGAA